MDLTSGRRELDEMDASEQAKYVEPTTFYGKVWSASAMTVTLPDPSQASSCSCRREARFVVPIRAASCAYATNRCRAAYRAVTTDADG